MSAKAEASALAAQLAATVTMHVRASSKAASAVDIPARYFLPVATALTRHEAAMRRHDDMLAELSRRADALLADPRKLRRPAGTAELNADTVDDVLDRIDRALAPALNGASR